MPASTRPALPREPKPPLRRAPAAVPLPSGPPRRPSEKGHTKSPRAVHGVGHEEHREPPSRPPRRQYRQRADRGQIHADHQDEPDTHRDAHRLEPGPCGHSDPHADGERGREHQLGYTDEAEVSPAIGVPGERPDREAGRAQPHEERGAQRHAPRQPAGRDHGAAPDRQRHDHLQLVAFGTRDRAGEQSQHGHHPHDQLQQADRGSREALHRYHTAGGKTDQRDRDADDAESDREEWNCLPAAGGGELEAEEGEVVAHAASPRTRLRRCSPAAAPRLSSAR